SQVVKLIRPRVLPFMTFYSPPPQPETAIETHNLSGIELREATLPSQTLHDTLVLFCHGVAHQGTFFDEWSLSLAHNDGIHSASLSYEGHGASPLLPNRTSINELTISDYKLDITTALEHYTKRFKEV